MKNICINFYIFPFHPPILLLISIFYIRLEYLLLLIYNYLVYNYPDEVNYEKV
jgi:hypothetical protein